MPKATKLVVHFDDGSTYEIPAEGTGSIFLKEEKAKKCGHNPPYKKPPKKGDGGATDTAAADATADETAPADTTMMAMEGSCYIINGLVVCP
jgi:hypothetical protein